MRIRYANERKLRVQTAARGWTKEQILCMERGAPQPDMFIQGPVAGSSAATASNIHECERETIYAPLLDEGIEVWRPAAARKVATDTYLILDQNYDREVETWKFEPGTLVRCRTERQNGHQILVATEIDRRTAAGSCS